MKKSPSRGLRTLVTCGVLTFGCNLILGNDERTLIEGSGGLSVGMAGARAGGVGGARAGSAGSHWSAGDAGLGAAPPGSAASGAAGELSGGAPGSGGSLDVGGAGAHAGAGVAGTAGTTNDAGQGGGEAEPCACTPGKTQEKSVACGNCGTSTQTKTCGDDCRWGEYGPLGECSVPAGNCAPGAVTTRIGHCVEGGWKDQTQTCGTDCKPGPWVDASACQWAATRCTGCACVSWCKDEDRGGATTCLWVACSEDEAWTECRADITRVCGAANDPVQLTEWLPN